MEAGIRTSRLTFNRKPAIPSANLFTYPVQDSYPLSCEPLHHPDRPCNIPHRLALRSPSLEIDGWRVSWITSLQCLTLSSLDLKQYQGRSCIARGAEWEMMSARLALSHSVIPPHSRSYCRLDPSRDQGALTTFRTWLEMTQIRL